MQILLPIHILAGVIALICSALAVSAAKGKKLHVLSGRTYFWCMVVNPPFEPEWVWWVLPTALITPVSFWWNNKVLK